MDIALYIAELLHQYNEVNVVGLGTFFKKRISGFYDERSHAFVPPTYRLAFKLEQSENLTLANYCCTQRNISQATAIYFIEKFVKSIWAQLNRSGYAELKALGTLRKVGTSYTFEAKEEIGYNHTHYGLKPVSETNVNPYSLPIDEPTNHPTHDAIAPIEEHIHPNLKPIPEITINHYYSPPVDEPIFHTYDSFENIQKQGTTIRNSSQDQIDRPVRDRFITTKQQERPATKLAQQEIIIPQQTIITAEPTEYPSLVVDVKDALPEEKRKPWTEAILAFVSLLLVVGVGIYYFYPEVYKYFTELFPHTEQAIAPPLSTKVEPLVDSTMRVNPVDTLQEKKSESLKQRDTIQTNTHTLPPPSTDGQTSYEIIVATFARRSEAEDYVARSIKKGIVVKILDDAPGSRIRISYASFTNKDLAEMELTQIRKNISPDAWMAIINPKKL